jgi:peptidyl-tRNA hydrolase
VAVRGDLCPGLQTAQAVHAAVDFTLSNPVITQHWHDTSNNVVIVSVPSEAEILVLESMALTLGVKHHLVIEPDIGDAATAIALQPGPIAKRLCATFPLALKESAMT